MLFVGTQQTNEQTELNTRERKGQDATKITSAFRRVMHPISLVSDADFDDGADVENIPNRNTIEDFTEKSDEARFIRQYNSSHLLDENVVSVFALLFLLYCVAPLFVAL